MTGRKKIVALMAAWGKICPLKDAEDKRDARLVFCAQVVGHIVRSAKELSEEELEKVIQAIHQSRDRKGAVVAFPNRNIVTKEQAWKIRQLEKWMGWDSNPKRLEGFLRSKFHVSRSEYLSFAQAWRAIEALFSLAARERIKAREQGTGNREQGAEDYKVGKKELAAARGKLKEELRGWRPETAGQKLEVRSRNAG